MTPPKNKDELLEAGTRLSEELHPLEAITSLYLVRHGHTRATELGLLYSDPKIEITEKGLAQAQAAAKYVAATKPQILLCGAAVRVSPIKPTRRARNRS
jgi:hypothetical protein